MASWNAERVSIIISKNSDSFTARQISEKVLENSSELEQFSKDKRFPQISEKRLGSFMPKWSQIIIFR